MTNRQGKFLIHYSTTDLSNLFVNRELLIRFSTLISMRQFESEISNTNCKQKLIWHQWWCHKTTQHEEHIEDDYDVRQDPNLTLNLLRQTGENEIRSGSAKLNERRSFYFSSSITENMMLANRASPNPSSNGCSSEMSIIMQGSNSAGADAAGVFMNLGLSLEAAPFTLSRDIGSSSGGGGAQQQ